MPGGTEHPGKIRLDLLLVERGLAPSRQKARALIMAGVVTVAGRRVDKAGVLADRCAAIEVIGPESPYVSRGGLKLAAALEGFAVAVGGLTILDVGAATGGFTDCLLKHGAGRVLAVDVGYGQLDWGLRCDPRVLVYERTNARHLQPGDLPGPIHAAVIDAAFISLRLLVPSVGRLLEPRGFIIALIKPQFEVGKGLVGKGGVVRDPQLHQKVIRELEEFFLGIGWRPQAVLPSPLLGPKGNREFLIHLTRYDDAGPDRGPP